MILWCFFDDIDFIFIKLVVGGDCKFIQQSLLNESSSCFRNSVLVERCTLKQFHRGFITKTGGPSIGIDLKAPVILLAQQDRYDSYDKAKSHERSSSVVSNTSCSPKSSRSLAIQGLGNKLHHQAISLLQCKQYCNITAASSLDPKSYNIS